METQEPEQKQTPQEPKPTDVGTRYDHLYEYREALETCIGILQARPANHLTQVRIAKFSIAHEILTATLDSFSGYNETATEYALYKLMKTVPTTKDGLAAIGGIPLDEGTRKNTDTTR